MTKSRDFSYIFTKYDVNLNECNLYKFFKIIHIGIGNILINLI